MAQPVVYRNALALESMLLEYRLDAVLGAGGFGLTYLGWDTHLEKHVAIKEYMPSSLALREADGKVLPAKTENEQGYQWGLDRFIQEARTLAKFSHPNIVRVNRYFEANGTSYVVMDYEAGESLHQLLLRTPAPDEPTLKGIVMPILDGLQAVHGSGFLHRDIKPSNVFIRANGTPVLIDFGAARMVSSDSPKATAAIVTAGYAPLEQYTTDGREGPWTDIYALAGVLFRAVTGEHPPDAITRRKQDTVSAALAKARGRYTERFLKAVDWGMMLEERLRPQSVADWREVFLGRLPLTAIDHVPPAMAKAAKPVSSKRVRREGGNERAGKQRLLWISALLVIMLLIAFFILRRETETPGISRIPPAEFNFHRAAPSAFAAVDSPVDQSAQTSRRFTTSSTPC